MHVWIVIFIITHEILLNKIGRAMHDWLSFVEFINVVDLLPNLWSTLCSY